MDCRSFTTPAMPGVTIPGHLTLRTRRVFGIKYIFNGLF
jgi:hypothetical protein